MYMYVCLYTCTNLSNEKNSQNSRKLTDVKFPSTCIYMYVVRVCSMYIYMYMYMYGVHVYTMYFIDF